MVEPAGIATDDERTDLELTIADQIAELSQPDETPSEFQPPERKFDAEEIDFARPIWMIALRAVQGWLRLAETLPPEDPVQFITTLGRCLEVPVHEQVVDSPEHPIPSMRLLDLLSERLQRAIRLQDAFLADLEAEGSSAASATAHWVEAWDDEEATSDSGNGPVSAEALTWPINEFTDRATRGRLNLSPSYQRSDVWPTSDAQLLIESVLRGIPLPSVIILNPPNGGPYEVVDGKQRLTAILRFIGRHPAAQQHLERAKTAHPDEDWEGLFVRDYPRFRTLWRNRMREPLTATRERELYFPFKLRGGNSTLTGALAPFQGKYYTEIRDARLRIADSEVDVRELFEHVTRYKIPLIEYSRATPQQIHEVFTLYNKQGKHLNAEEIRNAVYHEVLLAKALIVASGDLRLTQVDDLDFLEPDSARLDGISEILTDYRFGTARYRRTKVLSWLVSVLLTEPPDSSGQPRKLSTARHTDALFHRLSTKTDDRLRAPDTIRALLRHVHQGLEAHSGAQHVWEPKFKDTAAGSKWQELQLIASALGVVMAATTLGDETIDHLEEAAPQLRERTASGNWQRPPKTQTGEQWNYIAKVSMGVVETLNLDTTEVSSGLRERYGVSGVETLQAIRSSATA